MSKIHKEIITCPKCQTKGEFSIWESMNVDINPELRDKLFNDEVFLYECPKCGHRTFIPYGTIYHDMAHHFMLFFDFFRSENFNYEPLEIPSLPRNDNYIFRHVIGIQKLKEKILLLEKGLNDIAIERMKYMIAHIQHPEFAEEGKYLIYGGVHLDDQHQSEQGSIVFFVLDENSDNALQGTFPMDLYYDQCLACNLDPRMKVEGCVNVDEGWIARQLEKETV